MVSRKDRTGERWDWFVALRINPDNPRYWIYKCDCGVEVSRCPIAVARNKYNRCRDCSSGPRHWAWSGVGEISHDYYTNIKHSAAQKSLALEVPIDYLWELYLNQKGRCAFTGWPIKFHATYRAKKTKTASLDRIDSSQGYVEGNLQWVHRDVNKLKKNMSDERFLELCSAVHNHREKVTTDDHG